MKLLEIVYFSLFYGILSIFLGALTDKLFTRFYPVNVYEDSDKKLTRSQFAQSTGLVLLQTAFVAVLSFYIRKIVALFPVPFNFCQGYESKLRLEEASGEVGMGVCLTAVQNNAWFVLGLLGRYIADR
jgi:hypothetical protein